MSSPKSQKGFGDLGISSRLVELLRNKKITHPTPIQEKAIPVALEAKDVLGIAQTGTGKTLAFVLPLLMRLEKNPGKALIVLPTRELAQQVREACAPLARPLGFRDAVLIGGIPTNIQIRDLKCNPRLIIATPGRLVDFMERKQVNLNEISTLVLDEADTMFDMGFAPQLKRILQAVPKKRQTLLFSATMPSKILNLVQNHMYQPVRIEISPSGTTSQNIEQNAFMIGRESKLALLKNILFKQEGSTLVFSRTKHGAKKINKALRFSNFKSAEIHSNRTQSQRKQALAGFRSGKYQILIATDIAARGIDVPHIANVINYDLPEKPEDYVHRIGRTGRAGKTGKAISFVAPDQRGEVRIIERLIRKSLTIQTTPELRTEKRNA